MTAQKAEASMKFSILLKKENELFVAHCLELDIVASGKDVDQVRTDIIDLVKAQVSYAFSNDNLDYLYHPAPPEVWKKFYDCKEFIEKRNNFDSRPTIGSTKSFVPPWMIATFCNPFVADHA